MAEYNEEQNNKPLYTPKSRKAVNKIEPQLSLKDEGVPDTHISMYDLFVSSKEAKKMFGEKVAIKTRKETYNGVLEYFNKYNARDYASFWNLYIEEIKILRLNKFANFKELEPLCSYIECFCTPHITKSRKIKKDLISFGIRRSTLREYYLKKEEAENNGTEFIPPKYTKVGRPITKDFVLFGEDLINTTNNPNEKVGIPRNEIFSRFEHWRNINGLSKKEAVLMALESVVDLNKTDGVGELSEYTRETIFDNVIYKTNRENSKEERIYLRIDADLKEQVAQVIKIYNNQPENKTKTPLTFSSYMQNASIMLNKKMGIKYTNPELYAKEQAMKTKKRKFKDIAKKGVLDNGEKTKSN